MSNNKVWFVTGASRGMGVEFVKAALAAGHAVAASGRDTDRVSKASGPCPLNPGGLNQSTPWELQARYRYTVA